MPWISRAELNELRRAKEININDLERILNKVAKQPARGNIKNYTIQVIQELGFTIHLHHWTNRKNY